MTEYRFHVSEHGTITRGEVYRLSDWETGDTWRHYWDSDQMVAVYDSRDYHSATEGEWTERAEHVMKMAKDYDQDVDAAMNRLAVRLLDNPEAKFIHVNVDRGVTLYALSWDGDPDRTWAEEIDAVNNGEVYRIRTEEYTPGGWFGGDWTPADEVCEEFYGEDQAEAGFAREFPLTEFPAEMLVSAQD